MKNVHTSAIVAFSQEVMDIDVALLRRCADDATEAVVGLWDERRKTFWRNTAHRDREQAGAVESFFPTVTLRCMDALLQLAVESPEWVARDTKEKILDAWIPSLVQRDESSLKSTLDVKTPREGLNLFTLSLYVQTFARICRF